MHQLAIALYPASINTEARKHLYSILKDEELTMLIEHTVLTTKRDAWVGSLMKEREVTCAIRRVLDNYQVPVDLDTLINMVKNQKEYA